MPVLGPALGHVVTAMATPFTSDGALDLDGAQRLADHLLESGTQTVLLCGTTGESPTVTDEEQWRLVAAVRDAVGDRAKVMVGTGTNDTAKTVKATERATQEGADAILLVTPYYSKPSQAGLINHFTTAAQATNRPVVLYDIPGRTSREIVEDTLVELASVPNIVAVKDAVGDFVKIGNVVNRTHGAEGGFEVYSGDDINLLPMLAVGAVGIVSVAAHVAGREIADLVALADTDLAKARELHLRLLPFFQALMLLEPNPAGLKGLLTHLGLPGGPVRPPLADAPADVVERIVAAYEAAGLSR